MRKPISNQLLMKYRQRAGRIIRSRVFSLMGIFFILGIGLAFRLIYVQAFQHNRYLNMGKAQTEDTQKLYSPRGTIYDRNGKKLAFSVQVKSFYADPKMMEISAKEAASLFAPILHVPELELENKLTSDTHFVWLARLMDPEVSDAVQQVIKEKQLKGFAFVDENKRYYPNDSLLANVLGFVGIDDKGLDGLEMSLDELIRGGVNLSLIHI